METHLALIAGRRKFSLAYKSCCRPRTLSASALYQGFESQDSSNGQPSGPTHPRKVLRSSDPREIQNLNTASLKEEDKFSSPLRARHQLEAEMEAVEDAANAGLGSVARSSDKLGQPREVKSELNSILSAHTVTEP